MERAFAGPYVLATRLGVDTLDPQQIAAYDPEVLTAIFREPPSIHRFPGAMAERVHRLAQHIVDHYSGDAARVWAEAESGESLYRRVAGLPGFGAQKARIFVALLGKQLGVRPPGWQEAAGDYGADGARRSVADVTGPETLAEVREYKRELKRQGK